MDIQYMYMALRLAELGSFSLAADACYISQSSFSRNIQNIEKELGAELFIRKRNGVILTPEGKTFVQHAKGLLRQYEEMRAKLNNQIKHNKEYSIGLLNVSNIQELLPLLAGFIEANRPLRISLQELDWNILQTKMKDGCFDAVISWAETLPETMTKYKLAEDRVVLMASRSHPLAALADTGVHSIADICDQTFILSTPTPPNKVIDKLFAAEGFKPKFYHSASHPCSMVYLVEQGLGVGIIANSTYEQFKNERLCKIELAMGYTFDYVACFMDMENKRSQQMLLYLESSMGRLERLSM